MNIFLWILQGILALAFVAAGAMKATRPINQLAKQMTWVTDVPVWLVRFIGIAELLGGIGLVLPAATGVLRWLTPLAAVGLAVAMLCAVIFHARRNEFNKIAPSLVLFVLVTVVAVGRFWIEPL